MRTTTYFIPARKIQYSAKTLAFQQRVEADGGYVIDLAAVEEAYGKLAEWNVYTVVGHWSSPRFGYKLNAQGQVITRYCLFGNDAQADSDRGWTLLPSLAPGKAPQMEVTTDLFTSRMVVPALTWHDRLLTLSVVATAYRDTYADGHYSFFPLVELSPNFNGNAAFLLGNEAYTHANLLGGFSNPFNLPTSTVPITLNAVLPYSLRVNDAPQNGPYVDLAQGPNKYRDDIYKFGSPQPYGTYSTLPIFLGGRGDTELYRWVGTLNDVFFVNTSLNDAAVAWLDALANRY